MKKLKSLIAWLLCVAMLCSLVGCVQDVPETTTAVPTTEATVPETTAAAVIPPEELYAQARAALDNAENVTLPFSEYIKNVASSEIYPTWPENALRANIYAIISFVLNRVYTEYYRSRGYNFDITNSTAIDQAFVRDREIFENIGYICNH